MRDWITITDIGGGNPVRLETSGVNAGWSVTSGSTASVEVLSDDLIRAGLGVRPKGRWFFWDDQDAGAMNGTVTDSQPNGDDTVEIAAGDWRTLFDARRLPRSEVSSVGYAGALALIAISNCQHDEYLWIEEMTADEGGEPIELPWDGGDLLPALDRLASATGQEYWIDPYTRDFFWQYRSGQDLTTRVELAFGRHIIDYTLPDSIEPIRNDLIAIPSNDLYSVTQALAVFDDESIARYGRRQGSKEYLTGVTESALRPVATADLARLTQLGASIEATVINSDYCWSWFREGDSISLLLPNISSRLSVRVMARALDTSTQLMRISATVDAWREF